MALRLNHIRDALKARTVHRSSLTWTHCSLLQKQAHLPDLNRNTRESVRCLNLKRNQLLKLRLCSNLHVLIVNLPRRRCSRYLTHKFAWFYANWGPKFAAKWLIILLFIRDVMSWNLGPNTNQSMWFSCHRIIPANTPNDDNVVSFISCPSHKSKASLFFY
jgi:hypothetical protein